MNQDDGTISEYSERVCLVSRTISLRISFLDDCQNIRFKQVGASNCLQSGRAPSLDRSMRHAAKMASARSWRKRWRSGRAQASQNAGVASRHTCISSNVISRSSTLDQNEYIFRMIIWRSICSTAFRYQSNWCSNAAASSLLIYNAGYWHQVLRRAQGVRREAHLLASPFGGVCHSGSPTVYCFSQPRTANGCCARV